MARIAVGDYRWTERGSLQVREPGDSPGSGAPRTFGLIYGEDGDNYVIVGSKGGAPTHPAWYYNILADPDVQVQINRMPNEVADPIPFPGRLDAIAVMGTCIRYPISRLSVRS